MSEGAAGSVLALDGGQSGIRTLLVDESGTVVAESAHPGILTDRPVLPQLADVVAVALADAGRSVESFAGGISGLADDDTPEALLALVRPHGVQRVFMAHDSVTSYVGAIGAEPGVVTASGTGVVTLAVGVEKVCRVDGWGYLIGDAGSGFWIGRAALDAVMRAFDGRGPATSLTPLAEAEFGDLADAYLQLQADGLKVSRIARWAKVVSEHAGAGDEVCIEISRRAGEELAWSALTGLRLVGQHEVDEPLVSQVGNVFLNPLVEESFRRTVLATHAGARVVAPRGTGLAGASQLPTVGPDSALYGRIARA
ncbi:N-acetylglucosamine kinase [Aestuariimicrobium ganziense]|uniref:N-acetylglucosamine kinase n=1 Tax=Aestuariimicrobium ganziense TaxID=2773677 RepID=UPI001945A1E7|nr:BadF/BadG/BcrA/BcrD ATPase family protein [Aestuariimicrobium ganziense]